MIEGVPVVVIQDGRPVEAALRLERVALDDVLESARNQGIANVRDIRLAVLEPSGKFSFLQRDTGDRQHTSDEKHHSAGPR
jgi:uncharacterized membrane protein YcaP (DUF421 family)